MGRGSSTGKSGGLSGAGSSQNIMNSGHDITRADIPRLQNAMGQTGDEAGLVNPIGGARAKLYVNTSKSFNINYYLNTGGASIDSPTSQWQYLGYTKRMVRNDIARIDAGMKPLSESVNTTRWMGGTSFGYMFGGQINDGNIGSVISRLETDKSYARTFSQALKGTNYTAKAYTSTSYRKTHGTYDSMPIRLNMVMRKGTPAIVTNNHRESEIIGGRNLKYNFTGGFRVETITPTSTGRKQKQLVVDVYI